MPDNNTPVTTSKMPLRMPDTAETTVKEEPQQPENHEMKNNHQDTEYFEYEDTIFIIKDEWQSEDDLLDI